MASAVAAWPMVALGTLLGPISRPVSVQAADMYPLLGMHWYAEGLYVKDRKLGAQIQADTLYQVCQGDFVYNRLFAWKGSFGLADPAVDGCYVSNEFPCFRAIDTYVSAQYLRWYFAQSRVWEEARGKSSGSTPTSRLRLKEQQFLATEIALPPLDEQRRIVARIEALAARIAEARGLRREAMAEVASFVSSTHLEIAGSRSAQLGDMLTLEEDRVEVTPESEYPQVGVRGFGGGLFARGPVDAAETTYRSFNRLYEGAIVLSQVKGWEGAIAACDARFAGMFASPEYRTFRCRPDEVLPRYMASVVTTPWFWGQLKDVTRGVGARRERTRLEHFLALEMPMPTIEQQNVALNAFACLNDLQRLQAETAAELDSLLPAVLDRAFRGEL